MRIASVLALVVFLCPTVNACSTFCLRDGGSVVFGRNYDFDIGTGVVLVNPRGVQKTSLPKLNSTTLSWVSKYGSVTFNQFGKDYPMDGMNEAGLVVALMWLDGSVYPADDARISRTILTRARCSTCAGSRGSVERKRFPRARALSSVSRERPC